MAKLFRFKDFDRSENARLRSENTRLRALIRQLNEFLNDSADDVVDLKFSLEEATGVAQE